MRIQSFDIPQNRAFFLYSQNDENQLNAIKDELANAIADAYKQSVFKGLAQDKRTLGDISIKE